MFDILQIVPGKKKISQSGWHSFNAPCCHHRGHKPDKRARGGIKIIDDNNWNYHCFNCQYKCGFNLGKSISKNTKQFLLWCGIDEVQINKYSLESLQHKDLLSIVRVRKSKTKITFKATKLPNCELIDISNSKHQIYIDYLTKRKIDYNTYPFMVTPDLVGRNSQRIIIPFTHNGKIVGHTSRFLDNRIPKFISEQQSGYLFGLDLQKPEYEVCIVVEGIFDALSINGVALLSNTLNEDHIIQLKNLNKKIILVPDQDKSGFEIIDKALDLGFDVSLPNWDDNIKDVNDSVVKYGRLPTLLSILQNSTNNKIKVEMKRKKIGKRI